VNSLSLEEVATEADVDAAYVRRLIELGALERRTGPGGYGQSDVRRVELLRTWEAAGFPAEAVVDLVRAGELSISWLDSPVMTRAEHLDITYAQLCREEDVPIGLVQAVQEALGFAAPDPHDRARGGDRELVGLVRMLRTAGAAEASVLGVIRVQADSLRRAAKAQAELYETEVEEPLRRSGWTEQELLDHGARLGDRAVDYIEQAVLGIFRRYREHIWIEHRIAHAEVAMESAGLHPRVPRPPAICFVDLTGYTRITEERGDEVAARLATGLTSLVRDISRPHGGTPIRWLGDGGMFHFKAPGAAVLSGLEMVEGVQGAGLPPIHIGIHTGPVIFQDGDVYGRTVNLAARIASYAAASQVLVSDATAERSAAEGVQFESLGPVNLKGLSASVTLYRAVRESGGILGGADYFTAGVGQLEQATSGANGLLASGVRRARSHRGPRGGSRATRGTRGGEADVSLDSR
jgi:adenylate cyclase